LPVTGRNHATPHETQGHYRGEADYEQRQKKDPDDKRDAGPSSSYRWQAPQNELKEDPESGKKEAKNESEAHVSLFGSVEEVAVVSAIPLVACQKSSGLSLDRLAGCGMVRNPPQDGQEALSCLVQQASVQNSTRHPDGMQHRLTFYRSNEVFNVARIEAFYEVHQRAGDPNVQLGKTLHEREYFRDNFFRFR